MCKKVVGRTMLGCACCFIVTHYVDGEHNIGMHFDKPKSIRPGSLITVVKTGAHGRPFRLELLDGTLLMERVLPPGTAVVMTLEANNIHF